MNGRALICWFIVGSILSVILSGYLLMTESGRLAAADKQWQGRIIESGAVLYGLHCSLCHGIRGEGVGQLGPAISDAQFFQNRLTEVGWQGGLAEYIVATTEHGRMIGTRPIYAGDGATAVMPPWHQKFGGPLRADEIKALSSFILNWEPTATGKVELEILEIPSSFGLAGKHSQDGKRVFEKNCAGCHSFKDSGIESISGPDLSEVSTVVDTRNSGQGIDEYIRESVLIPYAYIVPGYEENERQNPCGSLLTESELDLVIEFLTR